MGIPAGEWEAGPETPYRERARLIAFLAAHYPAEIAYSDASEPDWPVIILMTPAGQLSWHLAEQDLELFPHVLQHDRDCPGVKLAWDGHSTQEKYARLTELTAGGSGLYRERPAKAIEELTADAAPARVLREWRWVNEGRDVFVRQAAAAGLSKSRIHQLSGIARTTIDRILEDM